MRKFLLVLFAVAMALALFGMAPQGARAQGGEPQYAGIDKRFDGVTVRILTIGGGQYEAMYQSFKVWEEATGAKVEVVALLDGFEIDRRLKTDYATGAADYDVAWNHTSFMSQYKDFVED